MTLLELLLHNTDSVIGVLRENQAVSSLNEGSVESWNFGILSSQACSALSR